MGAYYALWGAITLLMFAVYMNTNAPRKISLAYFEYDGDMPDEIPSI